MPASTTAAPDPAAPIFLLIGPLSNGALHFTIGLSLLSIPTVMRAIPPHLQSRARAD